MNESTISVRYTKALYQVGEETNVLDTLRSNIEMLYSTINESEEFSEFLQSPIFKTSEKVRVFAELFSKQTDPLIINFFNLLAKNNREQFLPSICRNFLHLFKEKQGIKEVVITTAQPLDAKHREDVLKFLIKKFKLNIEIIECVSPEVIGGFLLRMDDQQIDASISSKLKKIKSELLNS